MPDKNGNPGSGRSHRVPWTLRKAPGTWSFVTGSRKLAAVIGLICLFVFAREGAVETQKSETLLFAVVIQPPTDKTEVSAQVVVDHEVSRTVLLADESILANPAWDDLEVCHALRARAQKTEDGYRILAFRMLDAGMLPMSLQGIAGDCLLKKALEYAPQF